MDEGAVVIGGEGCGRGSWDQTELLYECGLLCGSQFISGLGWRFIGKDGALMKLEIH